MIPRFGRPPEPGRTYRLRPGAYAILLRGREILLTHQAAPIPEYQLPGGGIDPGETPVVSLHREILEETGWRTGALRRIGAYRRFTYMPDYDLWAEKLCHVFVARPSLRHGPPSEPGHTAVWTGAKTALSLLASEGDRQYLLRLLR